MSVRLETVLAARCDRRFAVATGRAASAIAITLDVLRAASPQRRAVILPATLCLSPPAVTRLAGLEPVFCDCDPQTGAMDPVALEALLVSRTDVLCVMAVHLYGQPCRIGEIAALCRRSGVMLVEDAAQAWGARIDGAPAGSFGDVSIVSFGHTKVLDAGGGGAALCDDPALAEALRAAAADLPVKPDGLAEEAQAYRTRYYALAAEFETRPEARLAVGALTLAHPGQYRYRIEDDQAGAVLDRLDETDGELAHRRALAAIYESALDRSIDRVPSSETGAPWRFGVLIDAARRDSVVSALRASGFDASTWYPCAARFFTPAPDAAWRGSRALEARIVNLWVDRATTPEAARAASALINEVLAQSGSSAMRKVGP